VHSVPNTKTTLLKFSSGLYCCTKIKNKKGESKIKKEKGESLKEKVKDKREKKKGESKLTAQP